MITAKRQGSLCLTSQFNRKNYTLLLQYAVLALGILLVTELLSHNGFPGLWTFIHTRTWAFVYNLLLIYFSLCLSLLFDRRRFWLALVAGLWVGISVANAVLMRYRSMPLTVRDIFLMSSVRDIFEIYLSPLALVGLMFLISALAALILYVWISVEKRGWIPVFALVHIVALLLLLICMDKYLVQKQQLDPKDSFYNLAEAYERNGFAYCFSAGLLTGGVEEPEEYSPGEVEEIIEEQAKVLPDTVSDPPNMIFVQLESFFDPIYLKGLIYSYDPIPNFRRLKEQYSHGFLSVPCIGAGTANTEFEVLTGMNLSHFGVGEYPYMTIVDSQRAVSLGSELWKLGYDTHALHNNNATFYNRHVIYNNLGFRTFTSVEYMTDVSYNVLGWAKDSCLTSEIMACLNVGESKDLVFAVSVEPHGRYPKEPIEGAPVIPVIGMEDEARRNGLEYYLYALSQSDRFVGELVQALSQFSEPTMVVFYGDHLPSFNIQNEELTAGTNQTTEYVIWTNYEAESVEKDLQTYQLGAYALELAGIYEGPVFRLHQSYDYDPRESELYQEDLRTLEYDMIYGEDYAVPEDHDVSAPEFRLGISDIQLRDVIPEEQSFTVTGIHFTPYTVIYVNDVPCETTYLSHDRVTVAGPPPTAGDQIFAAQVSAVDPLEILSTSSCLVIGSEP